MKPISVKNIRQCVNGQLMQGSDDFLVNDIIYHYQKMGPNKLLFLKQKWQIDWEKIAQSAPCVVVTDIAYDRLKSIENCTIIKVQDIEKAFWRFVNFYRNQFSIPVVSITGTSGKTTTKDMIKHILALDRNVTGTKTSANSRTHHLTYLLSIDKNTNAAVFESAVGSPGDVLTASRYFKPTIGIITNIGVTHLDGCKTLEAYHQAKAEMVQAVGKKGTLIINADDENTKRIGLKDFQGKVLTFGITHRADFRATNVQYGNNGMQFVLKFRKKMYPAFVPGYGQHQVLNALAAFAAVYKMGISMAEVVNRIESFRNLPSHLECSIGMGGCIIVDDTWNSNPISLKAAFQALNGISRGRKRIALIGDINALGELSLDLHRQVGKMIAENGVDVLITVGSLAAEMGKQAQKDGLNGEVYSFPDIKGVLLFLEKILDENSILLIKCSAKNHSIIKLKTRLKRRRTN
ncbi:UDP-N-acetylmuramoyl-tripeptide--D-alanyl-D-alanine ligase [Sporosarcina sp. FA9]|uniref:UDP-N-acetylmuramoyl-tripeptide--D-alanyl-D- alanine ligase n=1 Tax=Sporosarcina sp. FA9 TaxID=3413030 RepID=UPI003F656511